MEGEKECARKREESDDDDEESRPKKKARLEEAQDPNNLLERDVWHNIMLHCGAFVTDSSLSQVSKFLYSIARSEALWKAFAEKEHWTSKKKGELWRTYYLRPHAPAQPVGSHKTGSLNVPRQTINAVLQVPLRKDDPEKVKYSWDFVIARGSKIIECGIWDWKGSYSWNEYSCYGPSWVFKELFGDSCYC